MCIFFLNVAKTEGHELVTIKNDDLDHKHQAETYIVREATNNIATTIEDLTWTFDVTTNIEGLILRANVITNIVMF